MSSESPTVPQMVDPLCGEGRGSEDGYGDFVSAFWNMSTMTYAQPESMNGGLS